MSSLKYYPTLPPIGTTPVVDDTNESEAERPGSRVTGLELSEIEISCLTNRKTEDDIDGQVSVSDPENEATPTNKSVLEEDNLQAKTSEDLPNSSCSVQKNTSESVYSDKVESVNSTASTVAHFVDVTEIGEHKIVQNVKYHTPEMKSVTSVSDEGKSSDIAIANVISGEDISSAKDDSSHNLDATRINAIDQNTSYVQEVHQFVSGDEGAVNQCLETHPQMSLSATSHAAEITGQTKLPTELLEVSAVDDTACISSKISDVIIDDDDTDSSDVDFFYRINVNDVDYDSDDNLLTPEQQEEQRLWDIEFEKREMDLKLSQEKADARREEYKNRLANLTVRWNGIEKRLENRQVEKRQLLLQKLQQLVADNKRS